MVVCYTSTILAAKNNQLDPVLLLNPYHITSLVLYTEYNDALMAHPGHGVETMNVDTKEQRILTFSDLFSDQKKALKIIADYSRLYFMQKLQQENLPKDNFSLRAQMIDMGTKADAKNYIHWNIHQEYLQIIFERAQLNPAYFGEQTIDVPLSLLAKVLNKKLFPDVFQLQAGDLLFQDLDCGDLCDGINSTTYGYQETTVSHVAMLVSFDADQPTVIEAVSTGVKLTPLDEFLLRSLDEKNHPRTMVGRLDSQTAVLIPAAIQAAKHHLGASYNPTFSTSAEGFYCSQLMTQSFLEASSGQEIFKTHPMNFKLENSDQFSPAWLEYFAKLKKPIPQGQPGNNPGMLSRDPHVRVVYFYGQLR